MEQRLIDLNRFFREKGIDAQEIADKVHLSRQHVMNLLTGKNNFILKTACNFSDAFGLSPSWLMTGEGEMMGSAQKEQAGSRLKAFIGSRGLRISDVCRQANVTQGIIFRVMKGEIGLSKNYAERLSSALGVSAAWLLTGEGEMEVEGWTPPAELPAAPARVRNTDGGSSSKLADQRRENAELRAEVERLRGQVSQLLSVVQNLTGGKTEQ